MSSYISKKQKVFRDGMCQAGDIGLCRKRSDGRMKNFASCTDTRAWCIQDEERRQYILDLIQGPSKKGLCLGKYIPIEVLIDLLVSNKNADIVRLQKKVDELQKLLDIYNKLNLTEEQKKQLKIMKEQIRDTADDLCSLGSEGTSQYVSDVSDSKDTAAMESLEGTDDEYELEDDETAGYCAAGGRGLVQKRKLRAGPSSKNVDFENTELKATASETNDYNTHLETISTPPSYNTLNYSESYSNLDKENLINITIVKDEEIKQLKMIASSAIDKLEKLKEIMNERDQLKKKLTHSQLKLTSAQNEKALLAKSVISSKVPGINELETEINMLRESGNLTPEQETEIIKKELQLLKKYCDQLSNIQEENEQLKKQCEFMKRELKQKKPVVEEEEVEIELKYRSMEQRLDQSTNHIRYLEGRLSTARNDILQSEDMAIIQQRSSMLDDVIEERDNLQRRLNQFQGMEDQLRRTRKRADEADMLEREKEYLLSEIADLQKYKRQSDYQMQDIQSLKEDKNIMNQSIESIRVERDDLRRKVAEMASLQDALHNMEQQAKDYHCVQSERDMLRMKLKECEKAEEEMERLRFKAKEADVLRLERDRLQVRIEELSALEVEVLTLVEQVKNVSIERDIARRQCCDLHCIIADQEDEIQALVSHVDRLSRGIDSQQERIICALSGMRTELEEKNSKIAISEEQLAEMSQVKSEMVEMEEQLRCTIEELTKDLKEKQNMINSLQSKLANAQTESSLELVRKMSDELKTAQQENDKLQTLINDLGKVCDEDHVGQMLAESKRAVSAVIQEMHRYLDGANLGHMMHVEDELLAENKQLRKHSVHVQSVAQDRIDELSQQLNQAIQDNAQLRGENELLQSMTQGIENDLKKINSQLEENLTSSDDLNEFKQQLDACQHEKDELKQQLDTSQLEKQELKAAVLQLQQFVEGGDTTELQERLEEQIQKNVALEEKINQLKTEIEQKNGVVQKLSIEMEQIPETIAALSSVSQQFQEENEILKAENARLNAEIIRLEIEACENSPDELREQIAMLQSEILHFKTPDNDMSQLRAINKELENQVEHLKNEIDRLAEFLPIHVIPNVTPTKDHLGRDIEDFRSEVTRLSSIQFDNDDEIARQLKERYDRLAENHLERMNRSPEGKMSNEDYGPNIYAQVEQMKNIVDQQEEEIENLKIQNKNLADSLNNVGTDGYVGTLKKTIEKLESDIEDLKCENKCLRTCLLSTSPSSENVAFSELNLLNENKKLRIEINEMQEEIDCIRNCDAFGSAASAADEVVNLKKRIAVLEAQIVELEYQLKNLRKDREDVIIPEVVIEDIESENDVQKLKDKIGEQEKIIKNLRDKISELEGVNRILEMNAEKPANEDMINELKAKILKLEKEAQKTEDATDVTESPEQKIRDLEAKLKQLEEENAHLKDRLASMKLEQNELMEKLQQKIRRGSIQETELEAELRKYRTRVADLEDINDELRTTIESLKGQKSDSTNNRIKELEAKIADLESEKEHLENRISNKTKEQNDLADKLEQKIRRSSVQESELEAENMKLQAKIKELENLNKHLDSEVDVERKNRANIKESERRKSASLEEQNAALNTQINILKNENESLKKEVEDLKKKLDTLARESVPELENDIAKLRKQMSHLKDADKENEELKKQLDTLKDTNKENTDLKKQLDSLKEADKENTNLKNQLDSLKNTDKENADLKKQLDSLKDLDKENTNLKTELDILKNAEKENADLKKQMDSLKQADKENADLKKQLDSLKNIDKENADLKKQMDSLKEADKENADLKNQLDNLKDADKENAELKKQMDSLKEADKQNAELKKQIDSLKDADKHNSELKKQIEDTNKELNALLSEVDKLKKENDALKQKVDSLEKDTRLKQDNEALKQDNEALQQKINDLMQDNIGKQAKYEQDNERFKREIEDLKQKIIDDKAKCDSNITALEEERTNLKTQVQLLNDKISKLENQDKITSLEQENNTLKNGNTTLEKQNGDLNSENNNLKKEIDSLRQKIDALEKGSSPGDSVDLTNENNKLKEEIDGLKQKIKDLEAKVADKPIPVTPGTEGPRISTLEKENAELKKEVESLKQKISDLEKELGPLKVEKGQLDALQKENQTLKNDMDDLLNKLQLESGDNVLLEKEKQDKQRLNDLVKQMEQQIKDLESNQGPDSTDQLRALKAENEKLKKGKDDVATADSGDLLQALKAENDKLKKENAKLNEDLIKTLSMTDSGDILKALKEENDRLKKDHEQELKKMEDEYKKNLVLVKEQYDTDVKFVRGRHSDSIVKLQSQHEDSMGEVNREYEKEIDNLQKLLAEERKQCKEMIQSLEDKLENERLQRGDQPKGDEGETGDTCGCPIPISPVKVCPCGTKIKEGNIEATSVKHATALVAKVNCDRANAVAISLTKKTIVMTNIESEQNNLLSERQYMSVEEERPVSLSQSVENILSKALKAGIENLNYDELSDLHKKTCKVATVLGKPLEEMQAIEQAPAKDRLSLMRRIANLETDLTQKQQYAHEKLKYLERSMISEKVLLSDTKNALMMERKKNMELSQRIGHQTREVANIEVERDLLKRQTSFHEEQLQELIVKIEEERAKERCLQQQLEAAENATKHMKSVVESERERARALKARANETIEMMRRRLEQSLDTEVQLRMQLGQPAPRQSQQHTRNLGSCAQCRPGLSNYSPDSNDRRCWDMSPRSNTRRKTDK
ncbi:hypothetical protein CBL_06399 [Carabus blaptoides fortunei]